jgi:serine/threonine protein phosphatase PrpC
MKEIVPLALEQSFTAMRERTFDLSIRSGFTIVVALLYFNRLWIANAGDARATICKGTKAELVLLCSFFFFLPIIKW